MDLMTREAAGSDQASSGRAQGTSRHTLLCPGGVSAAQLLPLLRLACMGATAEVRSKASQLAARRLRDATGAPLAASAAVAGTYGRGAAAAASTEMMAVAAAAAAECLDEAQLWLWMLPTTPIHGSLARAAIAGRMSEPGGNRNVTATTQPSASPAAAARSEAVALFLCNAVVQLTRRPHEVYELVQELLSPQKVAGEAPTRAAQGATREDAGTRLASGSESCESVSLLAVACVRGCLKALPSQKMAAADKQAICSYVAGAELGEPRVRVPEN